MTRGFKWKVGAASTLTTVSLVTLATVVFACTNYVGIEQVWGDESGGCTGTAPNGSCTGTSGVKVTGNDSWNGSQAMTQTVNSTISEATASTGSFYVEAEGSGSNTLNQGTSSIWYNVNTIPVGYTSHTTWGGDPNYDCMDWDLGGSSGVKNVGSVEINTSGKIIAAASGSHGGGTSLTLFSSSAGIAGPFSLASNEGSTNTSPQESGVCLSDSTSTNGNQAPLTLS